MARRKDRIKERDEDLRRDIPPEVYRAPISTGLRQTVKREQRQARLVLTFYPTGKEVIVKSSRREMPGIVPMPSFGRQRRRKSLPQITFGRYNRREMCNYRRERQRRAYFGFKSTGRKNMPHRRNNRFTKRC